MTIFLGTGLPFGVALGWLFVLQYGLIMGLVGGLAAGLMFGAGMALML